VGPELYNKLRPYLGDERALMERMAGRLDLWEECVLLFPREEIVGEMDEAMGQEDYNALYALVHRVKGNLANFGFDSPAESAIQVLEAIKADRVAEIKKRYGELVTTYKEIIERIGEAE